MTELERLLGDIPARWLTRLILGWTLTLVLVAYIAFEVGRNSATEPAVTSMTAAATELAAATTVPAVAAPLLSGRPFELYDIEDDFGNVTGQALAWWSDDDRYVMGVSKQPPADLYVAAVRSFDYITDYSGDGVLVRSQVDGVLRQGMTYSPARNGGGFVVGHRSGPHWEWVGANDLRLAITNWDGEVVTAVFVATDEDWFAAFDALGVIRD